MPLFRRSPGGTPCWSCGVIQGKHGKNCKAKAGKQPGKQTDSASGKSGSFKACGFRWTNPTRPKRGEHFMHTCANPVPPDATDNMCVGPHWCVSPTCGHPHRSK